jgi:hypothetical protein
VTFADRLSESMRRAGLTAYELAQRISNTRYFPHRVDPKTVYRWTSGENTPEVWKQEWLLLFAEEYRRRKYAP